MSTQVQSVTRLSASMIRVVVHGPELARFADPEQADSYVKVVFLVPGVTYPRPIDPNRIRAELPAEQWPAVRTYTVRAFDRARLELTLDFVIHGTAGVAGPWATGAAVGDEVLIMGPGGGYSPQPEASWHLLVGDEAALPAIAVALERIPASTPVSALVEVHGREDEIDLARPVTWLHRGDGGVGELLTDAVRNWTRPAGEGQAFVHGEAGWVRDVRRHLRVDRELPLGALSISGYWRVGVDDEGWRATKREWNAEIEAGERTAGAA
jgi:NADPH-dependent ferric siderophore reductase